MQPTLPRHLPVAVLLMMLVAAACGTGAATPGATGTTPTTTTATTAPAETGPAGGTTAPTTGGGNGTATDWCLNSPPEVEAALHVLGVVGTSTDTPGVGGGCTYALADGTVVHAVSVVNSANFAATFEAGKQTPGAVEIPGIGNGAVLMSPQGPLVILKNTGLISMGPLGPADIMGDPAAYRTAVEALGRAAADRLP